MSDSRMQRIDVPRRSASWLLGLSTLLLMTAPGSPTAAPQPSARPATPAAAPAWVCPMADGGAAEREGPCPRCGMALVAAATAPAAAVRAASRAAEPPPRVAAYVCSRGDGTEDVEPGRCARCGAELVEVSRDLRVAILVFEGVQIADFAGPYEVFGQGRCETFTVAKTADPITASMGLKVVPTHSFASCPPVDILVIPGGSVDSTENDAAAIGWLRERGEKAQFVLSVCNGAFLLAKTGLIDGRTATTFYDLIDEFETRYPKVKAVRDRRYVDNGKFVTTAGISSGIDGSLHVIEKLRGRSMAQRAALNMEYDWKQNADYARAAFADAPIRSVFGRRLRLEILEGVSPLVVDTHGDRDRWQVEWRVATPLAAKELLARLDQTVSEAKWTRAQATAAVAAAGGPALSSTWSFEHRGQVWRGVTEIEPEAGNKRYRVRVRVERG